METDRTDEKDVSGTVSQLDAKILGLTYGILFGLAVFIATNWLVIRGGVEVIPGVGFVVGPHLQLLGNFFIGYTVSFLGSIIGGIYGFVAGVICGAVIGWVYNGLLSLSKK